MIVVHSAHLPFWSDHVSALSDTRIRQNAWEECLSRAFDKAVRRKPLAFAADADLWGLNVGGEGRCWVKGFELV